jgi:hypothetical protein
MDRLDCDAKVKYIAITRQKEKFRRRPKDGPPANYTQKYPIVYDWPDLTVLRHIEGTCKSIAGACFR